MVGFRAIWQERLRFFYAKCRSFNYPASNFAGGSGTATTMTDLIYIAVTLGFFTLGALYARFCETL